VEWRWDSGGGLDNAIASLSEDSGISWTVDAGGADYLFEIIGSSLLSVEGAQVFSGYTETGDWIIALTYDNKYVPYYPNENPETYFHLQLLDGITVKASTGCYSWGYRPGCVYLSKALADTLEWGNSDYSIRLYGDFGASPAASYNLEVLDWRGADLALLDTWVITQATAIGTDIGTTLVTTVEDKGEVLNNAGKAMFTLGLPDLSKVRPYLFSIATIIPTQIETDYTNDLEAENNWETRCGPEVSSSLTSVGRLLNVDGQFAGQILIILVMLALVVVLSRANMPIWGSFLACFVVLLAGFWLGFFDGVVVGGVTFSAIALLVLSKVMTR